jgi:phage baseplate assembly protein W
METIRLNKLAEINPLQIKKSDKIFVDLHLDLTVDKNLSQKNEFKNSNDILVDYDENAIRNSLRNIFSTRKGQIILNPEFGSSLEQFLFESVDDFNANIIGNTILQNISEFEPRIEVINVRIMPKPDENMYKIALFYRYLNFQEIRNLNFSFLANSGEIDI